MNVAYTVCEVLVAIGAVVGNGLVILAFRRERKLRRRTNYYIVSLAVADLLVGLLGIPCALLASMGYPKQLHACLFTVSLLVVLCTISIFCLVAVSVDRYWAILHPMGYSRNVRTKTAIGIICACWVAGSIVGFLPLFGWNAGFKESQQCLFTKVMDYSFLVFLYFATIIIPALVMAAFYAHIYTVVVKQLKQMVTVNGAGNMSMLRVLGAARKREVKATQNLSIIVLFFMVCWIPLYTINCVQAFCTSCSVPQTFLDCCIILSHLNSAGNPLLYAYHLRDFRSALKGLLFGNTVEKRIGRDNSAYVQDTPTERREGVKKITTVAYLYHQQSRLKLQGRSMFETSFQRRETIPPIYNIGDEKHDLPHRPTFDSQSEPVLETNGSNERIEKYKLQKSILDLKLNCVTEETVDNLNLEESPLGFVDEQKHSVYALGPLQDTPSSPELSASVTVSVQQYY